MLTSHLHQIIIDVIGQCLKRIEFYFLSQGRLLKFAHALSRCSSNHALRTSLDCKKPLVNGSLEYSYMSEASREQANNSNHCVHCIDFTLSIYFTQLRSSTKHI